MMRRKGRTNKNKEVEKWVNRSYNQRFGNLDCQSGVFLGSDKVQGVVGLEVVEPSDRGGIL